MNLFLFFFSYYCNMLKFAHAYLYLQVQVVIRSISCTTVIVVPDVDCSNLHGNASLRQSIVRARQFAITFFCIVNIADLKSHLVFLFLFSTNKFYLSIIFTDIHELSQIRHRYLHTECGCSQPSVKGWLICRFNDYEIVNPYILHIFPFKKYSIRGLQCIDGCCYCRYRCKTIRGFRQLTGKLEPRQPTTRGKFTIWFFCVVDIPVSVYILGMVFGYPFLFT